MLFERTYQQSVQFDHCGFLLNCKNGTMNLKTMELQPHSQCDHITLKTNLQVVPKDIKDYTEFLFDTCFKDWFYTEGITTIEEAKTDTEWFLERLSRSLNGDL